MTSIGEFGTDTYAGDDSGLLWAMFIITTFILSIVMLNMLIAMMGQSYEKVSEVAQATMLKERMLLIMENFFLIRK
jgi:Ion transport protein